MNPWDQDEIARDERRRPPSDPAWREIITSAYDRATAEHGNWWEGFDPEVDGADHWADIICNRITHTYFPDQELSDAEHAYLYEMVIAGLT
jgi:hypothetical protein